VGRPHISGGPHEDLTAGGSGGPHEDLTAGGSGGPHEDLTVGGSAGCLDFAEQFRGQEIDGQALLLLEEDHLMGTMNIKLGPALKICAQISSLRDS